MFEVYCTTMHSEWNIIMFCILKFFFYLSFRFIWQLKDTWNCNIEGYCKVEVKMGRDATYIEILSWFWHFSLYSIITHGHKKYRSDLPQKVYFCTLYYLSADYTVTKYLQMCPYYTGSFLLRVGNESAIKYSKYDFFMMVLDLEQR